MDKNILRSRVTNNKGKIIESLIGQTTYLTSDKTQKYLHPLTGINSVITLALCDQPQSSTTSGQCTMAPVEATIFLSYWENSGPKLNQITSGRKLQDTNREYW